MKSGINDSVTLYLLQVQNSGSGGSNALSSSDLFIGSGTGLPFKPAQMQTVVEPPPMVPMEIILSYLFPTTPGTGFTSNHIRCSGYML